MGANNPNNQMFGFPAEYVVNGNTQNLSNLITIGGSGFGAATSQFSGYRSGDRLICTGYMVSGTPAASLGWIQLPPGLTISTDTTSWSALTRIFGRGTLIVQGGALNLVASGTQFVLFLDESNKDRLYFAVRTGSNVCTQDTGNALFGASDRVVVNFDVPIAQWAT